MKRKFLLIFVSMFLVFSFVGGAICLNADTLFSASTEAVETAEEEQDTPTQVQASGYWTSTWTGNNKKQLTCTGSGKNIVVHIYNVVDLVDFMCQVNDLNTNYWLGGVGTGVLTREADVVLENDIDLSARYWTPIGHGARQFTGDFDGNGHTISGIYIDIERIFTFEFGSSGNLRYDSANIRYNGVYGIGFFGVYGGTSIKDLVIQDGQVFLAYSALLLVGTYTKFRAGALVGICTNTVEFYNVINYKVDIEYDYVSGAYWFFDTTMGGLVGSAESKITFDTCSNYGDLYGDNLARISAGGLLGVAEANADIDFCANFGEVHGYISWLADGVGFGGLVGAINGNGGNTLIQDCVNYGDVNIVPQRGLASRCVGGIIGSGINNIAINRCINYGDIYGKDNVGGIAGKLGSPKETSSFLWWSWTSKEAQENVFIGNCVNYGDINGSSNLGTYAGELNGQGNASNNHALSGAANSDIAIGSWYNKGDSGYAGSKYNSSTICKASFFTNSSSYSNFNGVAVGYRLWGWDLCSVEINSGGVGFTWSVTTIVVDLGIVSAPNSTYPYTMLPSYLLGEINFSPKYRKNGSTNYDFEANDDSIKFYTNMISSSNYKVSSVNIWSEDYVTWGYSTFYYLKGFSYNTYGLEALKIIYDASQFKASSISINYSINKNPTWKYTDSSTSSKNRTNYVCFNPGLSSSSSFTFIFQSQAKSLSVTYKLGEYIDGDGRVDSRYNFKSILDTTLTRTTYSDSYLTISGQKTTYYYKDEVEDIMIAPNFGYAVLYSLYAENNSLYTKDGSDRYIESLNPNTEFEPDITYKGSIVDEIKPSSFVNETMSFDFQYDYELVIYLVPVWYDINVLGVGDGVPENKPNQYKINSYAFLDGSRGSGTSNIEKAATFYREERGSLNEDGLLEMTFRFANYFDYGYRYKIYASTDANEYETSYAGGTVTLYEPSDTTEQLNTNQELRFGMLDLVRTAFLNGGVKSDVIYVRIEREAIEYDVEFVNMVDSYTNPGLFVDRTSQGIGGSSSMMLNNGDDEDTKTTFNVLDVIGFALTPKYGYKMVGSSFYERPNYDESSGENVAPGETFSTLLLNYIINICDYNVNAYELRDNKITIYAYYQLQTYRIFYATEDWISIFINGCTFFDEMGVSSENCSEAKGGTTSGGDHGRYQTVYYYAPVTISLGHEKDYIGGLFENKYNSFTGWWERPIGFDIEKYQNKRGDYYDLVSLNTEYTFFTDPNYVGSQSNTSDYEIYLVAMFETFSFNSTPLQDNGSNIIEISSVNDLIKLSSSVLLGNTFEGYIIKQTADISFSDYDYAYMPYNTTAVFYPIGTKDTPFKGVYDGQNHIISGYLYGFKRGNYRYDVGMFGYTDGAIIRNLTIKGVDVIGSSGGISAIGNAGVFVANAKDTTMYNLNNYYVNIEPILETIASAQTYYTKTSSNIIYELDNAGVTSVSTVYMPRRVEEAVNGNFGNYFGGIVGKMEGGSLYACSVRAKILGVGSSNRGRNAGIVGEISGGARIEECFVEEVASRSGRPSYDFSLIANYYDDDETNGTILNCYYRDIFGTEYINLVREDGGLDNVSSSNGGSGGYPLDQDIWFQLPNGYWTLRVFYWT